MNALVPIDSNTLDTVTGGGSPSNIDSLLGTLKTLTSSINDIKSKTNGLGQNEMLLLCMLAMQNRSASNVVYVGSRRPGCWW
ncbi:MAG: hypothetical protein M4D80_11750 [Myxococcota bacterium]|nr:hypothetical protein [Myxococcota bacterium]